MLQWLKATFVAAWLAASLLWRSFLALFEGGEMLDLEFINDLTSNEIMEIYARHVEQVNAVWAEDEVGHRTLGEAVKIWLTRKMQADPTYDWIKDDGEPPPPPMAAQLTPESTKPV